MARIDSFDDVQALGDSELRALVERGRPEERVWAIWALGLRSGFAAGKHELQTPPRDGLGAIAALEPEPGVRRNIAVVLAGHGELDLLVALAKRDPAEEVRGAAIQLVTRIALDGKLAPSIVIDRANSDTSFVKISILGTVFEGAPGWLMEVAQQLLEDPDGDVRYEAFEGLVRAGDRGRALMWLEEAPEAEARLTLMRWAAQGNTRACALTLAQASRRLRRLLIECVRIATWPELAPAVGDEPALIRALARRTTAIFDQMPLVTLIRATLREPSDAWIVMVRDRLAALASPDEADVSALLYDFLDVCAKRISDIDALVAEMHRQKDPQLQHELELLDDQRVALEAALEQASRLLVH